MSFAPDIFAGERYAVLGLGKAGLPAATALRAMGADVFVWDDGARAAGFDNRLPRDVPGRLDALVLSPGIPHKLPKPHLEAAWAAARGVPILTDAELLFRAVRRSGGAARFAGITGTNGKSTTTALLAHMLAGAGVPVAAGANLGPAALSLPLLPDDGVYVLEMSSYMLERLATLRFAVAAMLNLSPDHLDRHGDMGGYAAAKREIFARQEAGDTAVIGMDDAPSREMAAWLEDRPTRVVRISGAGGAGAGPALRGAHNAQNAAAAGAMAQALGLDETAIARGLASFAGLPHRAQEIANIAGVRCINDSKATNAEATGRAMSVYERFVWLAGGMAKAGGIEELAGYFSRIDGAFLIGRDGEAFAATLRAHGVPCTVAGTLADAVPTALAAARESGVLLFSPAAASFDQFANFEARGEAFTTLVRALA